MYMEMPKTTKAELVMMFLNQWNPVHGVDKDFRFYQVEAEEIAQKIRKNNKQESVENAVRESISFRMELEKVDEPFDEEACKMYFGWMLAVIKNQK